MLLYNHPFHLVSNSPWPFYMSISLMNMIMSLMIYFIEIDNKSIIINMLLMMLIMFQWWRDVIREGFFQGFHTMKVYMNMRMGMLLFIISEVMFFFGFFWAYFHMSLSPSIEIGSLWPPKSIKLFNPYDIPLLNTIILISSGFLITWSHYSLINNKFKESKISLLLTIMLGISFSIFQMIEYLECYYCISDSIFGSLFFMLTGFHGIHVLMGTIFLTINYIRFMYSYMNAFQHMSFEAAAWYWHFVDVVWLFLYMFMYCWIF